MNISAKRYATECIKASLEKASENACYKPDQYKHYNRIEIDKSSITDTKNIVLL